MENGGYIFFISFQAHVLLMKHKTEDISEVVKEEQFSDYSYSEEDIVAKQSSDYFFSNVETCLNQVAEGDSSSHEVTWSCKVCQDSFKSRKLLMVHFRQQCKHRCQHCGDNLPSASEKKLHIKKFHKQHCELCNKDVIKLKDHIKLVHDPSRILKQFKCEFCQFATHTKAILRTHVFVKHHKAEHKFSCTQCHKIFPTNILLVRHKNKRHLSEKTICDQCGKEFLERHICRGEPSLQRVTCEVCGDEFKNEGYYRHHYKASHGEEPPSMLTKLKFLCDQCPQAFTSNHGVYIHKKRMHMGDNNSSSFHNRKISGKGIFTCETCGKFFEHKKSLDVHIASKHLKLTPFACEQCEQKFATAPHMRSHIKAVHHREECPKCGIKISNKYWLRQHLLSVHNDIQEGCTKCDTCSKMFVSRAMLEKHKATCNNN
jgi:hypothetical protein